MKSGIYQIRYLDSGKVYVGSAVYLAQRRRIHMHHLRTSRHHSVKLQRAYNKHGEDAFVFEVLELVDRSALIEREQFWIDKLNSYNAGYNALPLAGSNAGMKLSEEQKEHLRKINTGKTHSAETIAKMRTSALERQRTPEHCANISKARTGKTFSLEARAKMSDARRKYYANRIGTIS